MKLRFLRELPSATGWGKAIDDLIEELTEQKEFHELHPAGYFYQ